MSFTDGKPQTATEEDIKACWSGRPNGERFRCGICGHRFKVGDTWRWVFTNNSRVPGVHGNPFICDECDGPYDVIIRKLAEGYQEFMSDKFWYWRK